MISCDAAFFIAGAFLLMLLPLDWILSAAVAALVHEGGHLLGVALCGGKIRNVRIHIAGCVMEAEPMGMGKSILCILSGPLASFSLLMFRERLPLIAVCGLLQGAYNMLPVLPLDGGRVFHCFLRTYIPEKAEQIMCLWERSVTATVLCGGIWLFLRTGAGITLLIFGVFLNIGMLRRKIPCKDHRIELQCY